VKVNRLAALFALSSASIARADDPDPAPVTSSTEPRRPVEPTPPVVTPAPAQHEPTAADVEGAPIPGEESGRLDRVDPGDSGFRVLMRAALYLPKVATEVVQSPVRGSLWAYDHWQLNDLYFRTFYNDDRTIGLIPTATYGTGLGLTVGAKFLLRDRLGYGEHLSAHVTYGGTYHTSDALSLRSGHMVEGVELGVDGNFDRRPTDSFYGIGNGDGSPAPPMLVDPVTDPLAFHTQYRTQELRAAAFANTRLYQDLRFVIHGDVTQISTSHATSGTPIEDVYDPMTLPGYQQDVSHVYGELELRYDSRRAESRWEPRKIYSEGSLASVYGGRVFGISNSPDFWHYGTDLQQYLRVGEGPRRFVIRLHGDAVSGSRNELPFVELPYLGGDTFLRGYDFQRFRDRIAAVGSVSYLWDVGHYVDAYLFFDGGRVYSGYDNLTFSGMRAGYGLGFETHDDKGDFILEGNIASSIDGGLFFNVSFNPVLDARARWR
jgi:hypothetical protein